MFFSIPVLTAVITFLTFTMLGNQMDAALIFSSMALFNLIQEYLQQLPRAVAVVTQVRGEHMPRPQHTPPANRDQPRPLPNRRPLPGQRPGDRWNDRP
jgi:hypothetical protein